MKKKIFLVISSLSAGGSERVFWLLSQALDKDKYEVSIVLFNSNKSFFSLEIEGVNVIDLKTIKASLSFRKLLKLIKDERPDVVLGTGDHINFLISFISIFVKIPKLLARPTCISIEIIKHAGFKAKLIDKFTKLFYRRFDSVVCQSNEIRNTLERVYKIDSNKLVVIPNPVAISNKIKSDKTNNHVIVVGRLSNEKGHSRLLDVFSQLPEGYTLTIAGDGNLRHSLEKKIQNLNLSSRVNLLGQVSNPIELISQHDLLVLSSHTEGFPNVVLESLSVGVPVVTFRVGGVSNFVINDFNGYIIEQDDLDGLRQGIEKGCCKTWNPIEIKKHIIDQFSVEKVAKAYESLMEK